MSVSVMRKSAQSPATSAINIENWRSLAQGIGVIKSARLVGVGVGTVQRIKSAQQIEKTLALL